MGYDPQKMSHHASVQNRSSTNATITYLCFIYLAVLNANHYCFSHPQNETNKKRNKKTQNGGDII